MYSEKYPFCIFSFGGGVQSSVIYLMLLNETKRLLEVMGELPDAVMFADTGVETQATYQCLDEMKKRSKQIGLLGEKEIFPIEIVSRPEIITEYYNSNGFYFPTYPYYVLKPDGTKGMANRQCTSKFKIEVIQKAFRAKKKLKNKKLKNNFLSSWLGISTDEKQRMRLSLNKWSKCRYPLIELGMSREDCVAYCEQFNWTPAKSRCWLCPYQSNENWLELKINNPIEWEKACLEDERIRHLASEGDETRAIDSRSQFFLHRSCTPLRTTDLMPKRQSNDYSFNDECHGICGV